MAVVILLILLRVFKDWVKKCVCRKLANLVHFTVRAEALIVLSVKPTGSR